MLSVSILILLQKSYPELQRLAGGKDNCFINGETNCASDFFISHHVYCVVDRGLDRDRRNEPLIGDRPPKR